MDILICLFKDTCKKYISGKCNIDFIDYCVDNKMLSLKEGISLNFYLLKECSFSSKNYNDTDIEIARVKNDNDYEEMIARLKYIFIL